MRIALVLLAACGVNMTPQPMPVPTLPSCTPNRDGMITADELPIALGARLDYYASTNVGVALTGKVIDLSQERASDTVVALGPVALGAQWYAAMFPAGQFAVDAGSGLDGIYHQDSVALWLDGTASQVTSPKHSNRKIVVRLPTCGVPVEGVRTTWVRTRITGENST